MKEELTIVKNTQVDLRLSASDVAELLVEEKIQQIKKQIEEHQAELDEVFKRIKAFFLPVIVARLKKEYSEIRDLPEVKLARQNFGYMMGTTIFLASNITRLKARSRCSLTSVGRPRMT
jgi:hypothetical protein